LLPSTKQLLTFESGRDQSGCTDKSVVVPIRSGRSLAGQGFWRCDRETLDADFSSV